MGENVIQCLICPTRFLKREELDSHTQLYQSKIVETLTRARIIASKGRGHSAELTTLLSRLNELVSHRGPEPQYTVAFAAGDDDARLQKIVNTDQSHGILAWNGGGRQVVDQPMSTKSDEAEDETKLKCPHHDCEEAEQTFSRRQDLERHYALHYENVTCGFCSKSFPDAKKYFIHNCIPGGQKEFKKRRNELRKTIRNELNNKRAHDGATTERRKRRRSSASQDPPVDSIALAQPALDASYEPVWDHALLYAATVFDQPIMSYPAVHAPIYNHQPTGEGQSALGPDQTSLFSATSY